MSSVMSDEELVFEGIDGTECERFIAQVRRRARAAGKLRDKEWILELVSTCFEGEALRWHLLLDPDIQDDWDKLQRAMIEQYPSVRANDVASPVAASFTLPTPAAAPIAAAAAASSLSSLSLDVAPRSGYIKIVPNDSSAGSYISRHPDKFGVAMTTSNKNDALQVRFTPSSHPHGFELLNSGREPNYNFLGAAQYDKGKLGPESKVYASVTPVLGPTSSTNGLWKVSAVGPTKGDIWTVSPVDDSIRIIWEADGCIYILTVLVNLNTKQILLVSNPGAFLSHFTKNKYSKANLVFQPLASASLKEAWETPERAEQDQSAATPRKNETRLMDSAVASSSSSSRRTSMPVIPTPRAIKVDTRGAVILNEESPQTRDSRGIYLPNHIEPVSHVAVDIGGSLAKVVYFTRSPQPPPSPLGGSHASSTSSDESDVPADETSTLPSSQSSRFTGALTPLILKEPHKRPDLTDASFREELRRRATLHNFPGGSLNFERFETEHIQDCVDFIKDLVERSAKVNGVSIEKMKAGVKIMATGGGAHRFYELFSNELGVEVLREDEMECLITGLKFLTLIPSEVYTFSDQLVQPLPTPSNDPNVMERPSPNPPQYQVAFEDQKTSPQLPCLLVNIGSGVSIIKVDEDGHFERVSGTSLGGGTLWGLLSLLTPATTFDEMLELSEKGDNATVDMLVGDIYGQDYSKLGLKSTMIASTFGKVFKKGHQGDKKTLTPEDISKSLLYAISNNIGQIAYMNAEKYGLDRIYFGGCFIRGHVATITTLSYAIRFWSKGTKRAMFLRHEGFLGSIGAWIKNIEPEEESATAPLVAA